MIIRLLFSVALLLPGLSLAADDNKVTPVDCIIGKDLKNSIDVSNDSTRIDKSLDYLTPQTFSKKGSTIIFQLPNNVSGVTVTESERKSRISDEYEKIKPIAMPIKDDQAQSYSASDLKVAVPEGKFRCVSVVQTYDLSRMNVQMTSSDNKTVDKSYIAGPKEHWYLSADLPVTSIKQLTYDAKSSQYVEKDVPATFYASVNFKIGDIYANPKNFDMSFDRITAKLMAKVTGPAESWGVGVGYDIGEAVLFAAKIITKNDPSASGADTNASYSTIFGVSFNIERGISWLSGK